MRAGRIIAAIVAALTTLVGFVGFAVAATFLVFHATQRGDDGYYTSSETRLETPTSALVAYLDIGTTDTSLDSPLGTVRLDVTALGGEAVFVGIGPTDQVRAWLAGTRHEQLTDLGIGPLDTRTEPVAGIWDRAPVPDRADFWVAEVSGSGTQQVVWSSDWGDWALVIMNADGSAGVSTDVTFEANTGVLLPAGLALGGIGVVLLAAGLTGLLLAVRRTLDAAPALAGRPGSYPVRLDAALAPQLSRGLWLVKWLLALPHLVVLALLWIAVLPLTFVAGLAILVNGRYPRNIFEFNVGVTRWTWRVMYYAFSAMGTDRYPPFSLRPDPDYPADFTVEYPQRLSRGLVLVKWWLLAIPHYLVVAFFAGGWYSWSFDNGTRIYGGGLIALIALIAVVILLFRGRYPEQLFTFLMGMNRWCFRVLAYATLMRDEYPPFRFDAGGADPGTVRTEPPTPPSVPGGTFSLPVDAVGGRDLLTTR